jgi:hypothetical protein
MAMSAGHLEFSQKKFSKEKDVLIRTEEAKYYNVLSLGMFL